MTHKKLQQWCEDLDITILVADGFEGAFLGVTTDDPPRAVYSIPKCIKILEKDMSREDAEEYFAFNVVGAYVGEQTPIFIETP
jgi:hypothetical protein